MVGGVDDTYHENTIVTFDVVNGAVLSVFVPSNGAGINSNIFDGFYSHANTLYTIGKETNADGHAAYNYDLSQNLATGNFGSLDFRLGSSAKSLNDLTWYSVEEYTSWTKKFVIMGGHVKHSYGTAADYYVPIYRVIDYAYDNAASSEIASVVLDANSGSDTFDGRRGLTKLKTQRGSTSSKIETYTCDERIDKSSGSTNNDWQTYFYKIKSAVTSFFGTRTEVESAEKETFQFFNGESAAVCLDIMIGASKNVYYLVQMVRQSSPQHYEAYVVDFGFDNKPDWLTPRS